MATRVQRSIDELLRTGLSTEQRWKGPDQGLITCWEVGRRLAEEQPDLANRARAGELPPLGWKGGIERQLTIKKKIGTLFYLAKWQGLRGDDLEIDLDDEPELVCSRTGIKVTFTGVFARYANA